MNSETPKLVLERALQFYPRAELSFGTSDMYQGAVCFLHNDKFNRQMTGFIHRIQRKPQYQMLSLGKSETFAHMFLGEISKRAEEVVAEFLRQNSVMFSTFTSDCYPTLDLYPTTEYFKDRNVQDLKIVTMGEAVQNEGWRDLHKGEGFMFMYANVEASGEFGAELLAFTLTYALGLSFPYFVKNPGLKAKKFRRTIKPPSAELSLLMRLNDQRVAVEVEDIQYLEDLV